MRIPNIFKKVQQFEFVQDNQGVHHLGGLPPEGFTLPANSLPGGIQYLGMINASDPIFSWLPFDLHIVYPIFLNARFACFDYINPDSPTLITEIPLGEQTTEYDDLTVDSHIDYERVEISAMPIKKGQEIDDMEIIGIAGKPLQVLNSLRPPNGDYRFVCQLMSSDHVRLKSKNFVCRNPRYEKNFGFMHFWEDGCLTFYFDPESKVLCGWITIT